MKKIGEISEAVVVESVHMIASYDLKSTIALCDHIHEVQPYIFLTSIDLINQGVSHAKLEYILHILMVVHMAFENEPTTLTQQISYDDIEYVSQKHFAMLRFFESEPDKHTRGLTITSYPEKLLWAYVIAYLGDKDVDVQTEEGAYVFTMAKIIVDAYHHASVKNFISS